MRMNRRNLLLTAALALVPTARSQFPGFGKKKKEDPKRTVKGQIMDEHQEGIRAVVQLKNLRTQDVKSFHTNDEGNYYFSGLDLSIDYEITALAEGFQSKTRTVSTFDSRTELIFNFELKAAD